MKPYVRKLGGLLIGLSLAGVVPAAAQPASALTLPVTGTFARNGGFAGTISINRFDHRGNDIIAVGFVTGVLFRGHRVLGTAVAGEVAWPVRVSAGGVSVARSGALGPVTPTRIVWSPGVRPVSTILRVQAPSCPILNLALGPINVNLLGLQVALSGVTFDLTGASGTALGGLVCAVSDLLGNVAGLVNLLNSILGLLTGLLGGLTGGLGGGALSIH